MVLMNRGQEAEAWDDHNNLVVSVVKMRLCTTAGDADYVLGRNTSLSDDQKSRVDWDVAFDYDHTPAVLIEIVLQRGYVEVKKFNLDQAES
ncbi:hypothetical protein RB195_012924 [Necator americanus]|uniref:Uncharacterized protein n=1 Tax=Necator americanus TaxID=51031 RepID=A0ABR1DT64_NECAM